MPQLMRQPKPSMGTYDFDAWLRDVRYWLLSRGQDVPDNIATTEQTRKWHAGGINAKGRGRQDPSISRRCVMAAKFTFKRQTFEEHACRCGSGDYCHRHRSYGPEVGREDQGRRTCEPADFQYEQCGGGRRVVRKTVEGP